MRILHLAPDERKFIVAAAEIFDACEEIENWFRVVAHPAFAAQQFFSVRKNIHVVDVNYVSSKALMEDFAQCDCLVVHFMDEMLAKAVMRAPARLPVVWSGWGGDYYHLILREEKLYGPETLKLLKSLDRGIGGMLHLRKLAGKLARDARAVLRPSWKKRAIKRVDFLSTPFLEDYELLKTRLGEDFRPVYTRVFYGSLERTCAPGVPEVYGDNILVGNSATPTNNHLEVFKLLAGLELGSRKIVVPLSYGDHGYRDAIISHARALFGERFHPLIEFMPLDQYNNCIAQCSIVVMGHRRQQGAGNTFTLLNKGAKVFMDEASTVYRYLKNRGAFVYALSELQTGLAFEPLTDDQKCKNRAVLQHYIGDKTVSQGVRDFVQQIRLHGAKRRA